MVKNILSASHTLRALTLLLLSFCALGHGRRTSRRMITSAT